MRLCRRQPVQRPEKQRVATRRAVPCSGRVRARSFACTWLGALVLAWLVVASPAAAASRPASAQPSTRLRRASTPPPLPVPGARLAPLPAAGRASIAPSFGVAALTLAPPPAAPRSAPIATPRPTGTGTAASEPVAEQPNAPRRDTTRRDRETDVRSQLLRNRSVPPFWIDRTYDTHRTRAIGLPPLFVHRKPTKDHPEKLLHADLSLTFGWATPDGAKRRWINPAGLFFGSFSERKTLWVAAPLLMGYRRAGEQFNFLQFPLAFWWGTRYVKNLLIVPFHYQQKAPDGFRGVSAILFWYGHKHKDDTILDNDRGWFVAAPVFWRFAKGLKRFDFAFLYMGAENKAKGRKWGAFTPFALWHQSEFGNRKELWSFGFIRRTDRARDKNAWAVPLALTFATRDRDKRLFSATPLVWRSRNELKGSRFSWTGLVGVYDDPRQRNVVVAPLWWQFRDKRTSTTTRIFAPFMFGRSTPERTSVWTLLGGGARTPNGYGYVFPPGLAYAGRRDDGRELTVAGGIFVHTFWPNAPGGPRRSLGLGPLAFYSKKNDRVAFGIPPLLGFAGRKGTTRWQVITPMFWHARDRAQGRHTLVLPPFYHHKTKRGLEGGLPPFAFYGQTDERRYGIAPLLLFGDMTDVKAQSRLTISPLFVRHSAPGEQTIGGAGIFWDVLRRDGAERHTALLPLFYRRKRGDERLVISAIGGLYRKPGSSTMVWGPWVQRDTPTRHVRGFAPLIWTAREKVEGGEIRNTTVLPLVIHRRAPGDRLGMYTPLIWTRRIEGEHARRNVAIVPFYFRQRQPGGVDVDGGVGFFFSRDPNRHTHTLITGPFFHRLSRKSINTGLVPLAWWMDSSEKRRLISLPAIVHIEDKKLREHTTVAVPLWFDRQRANGKRTWAAFPFVFGGKRLHNFTRFSLAPPGFVDVFRIQKNSRFTGFVPLLFRHRKCGYLADDDPACAYTLWGSVPLFLYGKDGKGRRTHGSLVYVWDRSPDGARLFTPLFGFDNRPKKVVGWYAGPVGMRTSNTHQRIHVFPLYFHRKHRLEDRSLRLVVPPLYIGRVKRDKRFFEAGLVVWQVRQQHKISTAVLPPLFFHSHAYAQRKLTWVLPLFLRDDNKGDDQAWTAIGPALYVQRRKGENLDFVQFPLVWHIERGENQGTFGAFVWWDIRARGRTLQMVPGAYMRIAGRRGDTKMIGPGLGWWTRGRGATAGDFHWRALLGLFGGGVEAGRKYVSIFGGRIDRGPGRAPPERVRRAKTTKKATVAAKKKPRRISAVRSRRAR